eukprot:11165944-Lingulodinium_polyedra.AAC.1
MVGEPFGHKQIFCLAFLRLAARCRPGNSQTPPPSRGHDPVLDNANPLGNGDYRCADPLVGPRSPR